MKKNLMYLLPVLLIGIDCREETQNVTNISYLLEDGTYSLYGLNDDQLVAMNSKLKSQLLFIKTKTKDIQAPIIAALVASMGGYDIQSQPNRTDQDLFESNFTRSLEKLQAVFNFNNFFTTYPKTALLLVKQFCWHVLNTKMYSISSRGRELIYGHRKIMQIESAFFFEDGKKRKGIPPQLLSDMKTYCNIFKQIMFFQEDFTAKREDLNRDAYRLAQSLAEKYLTKKSIIDEKELCIMIGCVLQSIQYIKIFDKYDKLFNLLLDKKVSEENLNEIFSRIKTNEVRAYRLGANGEKVEGLVPLRDYLRSRFEEIKKNKSRPQKSLFKNLLSRK
jgi:hypothetical protein